MTVYSFVAQLLAVLIAVAGAPLPDRLDQPQCRALAAQTERAAAAAAVPHAAQAVSGRSRSSPTRQPAVRARALHRLRRHGAGLRHSAPACRPTCRWPPGGGCDRAVAPVRAAPPRVFISLAAMDIAPHSRTLGARREMLVGFLAEPALLMVLFTAAFIHQSTRWRHRRNDFRAGICDLSGALAFAGVAFAMVSLAENGPGAGGQPGHAPRTDDDPRGDDPRVLGPPPGADRVGGEPEAVRLLVDRPGDLLPLGHRHVHEPVGMLLALPVLVAKLAIGGAALALIETLSAKMRIFRVPEFLAGAFPARRDRHPGPLPAARLTRDARTGHPADQPVRGAPAAAVVRPAGAAARAVADPLFTLQGLTLTASTTAMAFFTGQRTCTGRRRSPWRSRCC